MNLEVATYPDEFPAVFLCGFMVANHWGLLVSNKNWSESSVWFHFFNYGFVIRCSCLPLQESLPTGG
jgi:hypothetical protein